MVHLITFKVSCQFAALHSIIGVAMVVIRYGKTRYPSREALRWVLLLQGQNETVLVAPIQVVLEHE